MSKATSAGFVCTAFLVTCIMFAALLIAFNLDLTSTRHRRIDAALA